MLGLCCAFGYLTPEHGMTLQTELLLLGRVLSDPPSHKLEQAQQCSLIKWEAVKAQVCGLSRPEIPPCLPLLHTACSSCHTFHLTTVPVRTFEYRRTGCTPNTCPEVLNHTDYIISAPAVASMWPSHSQVGGNLSHKVMC